MNTTSRPPVGFLAAAAILFVIAWATSIRADVFEDFNTIGALDADFTHTAASQITETDGVGVGGTRGMAVTGTADSGYTYKVSTGSFDFTQVGFTLGVSAFFKTGASFGTTGEDRIFELNIVGDSANIVTGAHTGVGGKLEFNAVDGVDDVQMRFRRSNADIANSLNPALFDIKPNTWYKATFTAKNQGAGAVIPSTFQLDEYNAAATAVVTANAYSHAFDIPATDISIDTTVWAAFRVRNGTRLLAAIDDFQAGPFSTFHAGDVDKDGDVDINDFNAIRDHFQQSATMREQGDLNGDGLVDFKDFRQWKDNFPFTPPPVSSSGAQVPEPEAVALAMIAICFLPRRR